MFVVGHGEAANARSAAPASLEDVVGGLRSPVFLAPAPTGRSEYWRSARTVAPDTIGPRPLAHVTDPCRPAGRHTRINVQETAVSLQSSEINVVIAGTKRSVTEGTTAADLFAEDKSAVRSCAGVALGATLFIRATIAATCGAAALVP